MNDESKPIEDVSKASLIMQMGGAITSLGCAVTQIVLLVGILLVLGSCLVSFLLS